MAWLLLRDATLGQALRFVCAWQILQYPEDNDEFLFSDDFRYLLDSQCFDKDHHEKPRTISSKPSSHEGGVDSPGRDAQNSRPREYAQELINEALKIREEIKNVSPNEAIIVGWYGEQDPQNPKNWPLSIKLWLLFVIYLYCFCVYMGASIATPAEPALEHQFNVTTQVSSLILSLYVVGYGIGPMLWSPLSEIPILGRNAPYIPTMAIFVLLCIPGALVNNTAGILIIRFLQGFFGSPVLSIAAGSQTDMMQPAHLVYSLVFFQFVCFASPGTGPTISAFLIESTSWRWTFWELFFISGFTYLLMLFTLAETSPDAILLNRARRIRKITGDQRFHSASEVAQKHFNFLQKIRESLLIPFKLTFLDPAIAYANVYVSLNYAIYYSFFESFPLVYETVYGFSPAISSVMFISILIGAILAVASYLVYLKKRFQPRMKKGLFEKEEFLIPTLGSGIIAPIGLFIFAWTSRQTIVWVVSSIGVVLYCAANYNIFRGVLTYVIFTRPKYAASVTASNGFFRSALAAGAIHFSQPLFTQLGIGRGVSVLAGLTFGCWLLSFPLWFYGARLRQISRFTD